MTLPTQQTAVSVSQQTLIVSNVATRASNQIQVFISFSDAEDEDGELLVRNYVSHLWADDWDSPEDSVYDSL
jgi:hypothetical protein